MSALGTGRTGTREPGALFTLAVLVTPVVFVILADLFALAALEKLKERAKPAFFAGLVV